MSGTSRQPGAGSLFPPIEVGSFVSHRQDKSEFIGSASGIFFINTVFRAFAGASAYGAELTGAARGAATPESVHGFLTAIDSDQEPVGDGDFLLELINSPAEPDLDCTSGYSYGINIPGLGSPPTPAAAKKLLMVYFQKWHPFYPFLHGPTFFNKVDQFYDISSPEAQGTRSRESLRDKLCRAVCFQCIFNIAAINVGNPELLPPQSRITSPDLLTGLIGILAGGQDVEALQVLLAVELYLITRMASRAASTVHGTLTRVLYQAGLHRCPFRYVQLPNDMRAIRQRIWWCTYVLDRYLSQALGHPLSISDEEVDVCIPGMPELHNPVRTCHPSSTVTDGAEIRAHLPMNHESFMRDNGVADTAATASSDTADSQSPAHHYKRRPEDAGSLVLGYTVTYTQIFGAALRLFHSSIHKRSITLDSVLDITSRVHSWWNSLPASLQDEDTTGSKSSYGPYFAVLYHHLIIFINRPFLSLPTHREDFRSSLQSALNSSRTIIRQLQTGPKDSLLLAWPGALASIWMSSLVVAYASLLKIYPPEKGLV
ncbi:hypothetical protein K4F52_005218 [Lecanicillium sp. MT-2017a]|nr:hypothetical protein K4F52_005218 [Lecanicillium sp. MT-2017a]